MKHWQLGIAMFLVGIVLIWIGNSVLPNPSLIGLLSCFVGTCSLLVGALKVVSNLPDSFWKKLADFITAKGDV